MTRLTALANAEDIVSVGRDVSRYEGACHRAARDAYRTALDLIKGADENEVG